ncbi:MAG: hypothetical protein AAFS12_11435 [Cyanobacteria bacterium J06632_19]
MKISQLFTTISLVVTLSTSILLPNSKKAEAQMTYRQINKRPYAVFVNGYMDCCAWEMNKVKRRLSAMGAEIRDVPWDSFTNRAKQRSMTSNDRQFLRQAENYINNNLEPNRPLILIGHSFGGDSLLSLAPRIRRRILFLGVIDPVAAGGFREPIRRRTIPANVDYFFNRWQSNRLDTDNAVPFDSALNGKVRNCRAQVCDQKEQNIARRANGSPIKVNCGSLEVTCPGYQPWPGGSNGRKQKRLHHNPMPYDDFIQQQIVDNVKKLLN